MFYFENFQGHKILKSNYIQEAEAFFTTKNISDKCDIFPFEMQNVIIPHQVHSDNVEIVDAKRDYPATDGLILTNLSDTIALRFADCTPLIFYDKKKNIGAVAHAGWRGTVAQIGIKTVRKMQNKFGTHPNDLAVLIGPAIGLCCYEVSDDVKEKLLSTIKNTSNLFDGKYVDLKQINARQLEEIGVTQIDICPYCTSCNNDLFYSYRKENGTTFRHYAVMRLKTREKTNF